MMLKITNDEFLKMYTCTWDTSHDETTDLIRQNFKPRNKQENERGEKFFRGVKFGQENSNIQD